MYCLSLQVQGMHKQLIIVMTSLKSNNTDKCKDNCSELI